MSRIDLSSPIAVVVDRAHRAAVASSRETGPSHEHLDGLGDGFIGHYFKSPYAVAEALQPVLIELANDSTIASFLDEAVRSQIRVGCPSTSYELASQIVCRLSNPHRTALQTAVLTFLKSKEGTSFCFRDPQVETATRSRPHRPFPSALSNCPGREQEVTEIIEVLLSTQRRRPSVIVGGVGGIGKTTLALTVLNNDAVRDRYGNRRFWINCEAAYSAENFLEGVIAALSSSSALSTLFALPTNDIDQDFLRVLDRVPDGGEPAIVAFDNLETTFDTCAKVVERVLSLILQRAGVVVTLRGERRPSIGGIWSWPTSEQTRLDQLPESAWLLAFETHAGRRLDNRTQSIVEPILQHIGGYPLALFLLGRRLAHGQSSIDDLRQAWDLEISRTGEPDDTRHTSIITSIRTSLRSTVMVNTPFAIETLVLAAHLPPGFGRSSSGEEVEAPNGLPKWLGRALCDSEESRISAWAALTRCGLAYVEPAGSGRLQLLPPLQQALCWHESIIGIPLSRQQVLVQALDKVYEDDLEMFPPFSELDNGNYGKSALTKLGYQHSSLVPTQLQPQHKLPSDAMAQPALLLATICRHAGFLVSGSMLYQEASFRYTALDHARVAVRMRAFKVELEFVLACYEDRLQDAVGLAEEEAPLWEEAGEPKWAVWTQAAALAVRSRIAERDGWLDNAARLCDGEAPLWEEGGKPQWVAMARARALQLRSRIAERDNRLDDAARLRDLEAPLWEEGGKPQSVAIARAKALELRSRIAELDDWLDDAARLCDERAPLWEEAGDLRSVAVARATALMLRSRCAERDDRLADAARLRDLEAPLWEEGGEPQWAAMARAKALDLRSRIAECDGRLDDAARLWDEGAPLWEEGGEPQWGARARAKALALRAQIAERNDRLDDAARLRDLEAPSWEEGGDLRSATEARAKALELRSTIAECDSRLDYATQLCNGEAPLWEEAGKPQRAATARSQGCKLRARTSEREDHLHDLRGHCEAEAEWWDKADEPEDAAKACREVEEFRGRIAEREQHCEAKDGSSHEIEQGLEDEGAQAGFWTELMLRGLM